jgi:hypothetical protein
MCRRVSSILAEAEVQPDHLYEGHDEPDAESSSADKILRKLITVAPRSSKVGECGELNAAVEIDTGKGSGLPGESYP